jgi:FKBP-type peptidyl-prolyl cis-trans isomerase
MKKRENNPNTTKSHLWGDLGGLILFLFLVSCGNKQPQIPANKLPKNHTTENLLEMNKVLAEQENKDIEEFIEKSDIPFEKSPLAFWYFIEEKGSGKPIERGDKVKVSYNITLLDGTVCATPENGGTKTINIGMYDIIKGLDDSLLMLNEGGRGKFIIPSDLAYGMIGDGVCVGAKKTIIYDFLSVEVVR